MEQIKVTYAPGAHAEIGSKDSTYNNLKYGEKTPGVDTDFTPLDGYLFAR